MNRKQEDGEDAWTELPKKAVSDMLIRIMKRDPWSNDEVKKTVDDEKYKRTTAEKMRIT